MIDQNKTSEPQKVIALEIAKNRVLYGDASGEKPTQIDRKLAMKIITALSGADWRILR